MKAAVAKAQSHWFQPRWSSARDGGLATAGTGVLAEPRADVVVFASNARRCGTASSCVTIWSQGSPSTSAKFRRTRPCGSRAVDAAWERLDAFAALFLDGARPAAALHPCSRELPTDVQ